MPFGFDVDVKHMEITADTKAVVNGWVHFKGNVGVWITRNDGSVDIIKGNGVAIRPDQIEIPGVAQVTIRKAQ